LGKKAQLKKYTQNAIAIHVKRDRNSRKTRSQFTQNENVIHAKYLNDIPGRKSILRLASGETPPCLSARQALKRTTHSVPLPVLVRICNPYLSH
jgi:hypothetical protein